MKISGSSLGLVELHTKLVGGLAHVLFSISYMGCHPKPIDELHHFSRWLPSGELTIAIENGHL